jgi:hypothetical protein
MKRIIMADYDYVIFLGEDGHLDWQTMPSLDKKIDNLKDSVCSKVFNRAAEINTIPVEHLTSAQRENLRIMIGEGIARLFALDGESGLQMLDTAGKYATARNQEIARGWQLTATSASAAVFFVLGCFAWLGRAWLRRKIGDLAFMLLIGACAGAVGALFSILTRLGTIPLDPSAGESLHKLEGRARILTGAIGAVIAELAVYLSLILGVLKTFGNPALLFIALIAGTSERLVPTIIKRTETQAESDDKGTATDKEAGTKRQGQV